MIILFTIIGIIIGSLIIYFILKPKLKISQTLNEKIIAENAEAQIKNNNLRTEMLALTAKCSSLTEKHERIKELISEQQKQAEENANRLYEKSFELVNEKMSAAAEKMSAEYEEARRQMEEEYLSAMETQSAHLSKELNTTNTAIKNAETQLAGLAAKVAAAVAAAKRQEEMETAQDFYRLNLPDIDIEEIVKLREVTVLLRDSEPLNKVIWKVYYEKPYTDLIGRVVGTGVHTGIYKITNIKSQKCYVGQAADIASRWKQHIKRGIGAEAPTRNKLYPAMLEHGVENFTFEIVEECSRAQLNEREDYWQDYFGAKEFGYSIK